MAGMLRRSSSSIRERLFSVRSSSELLSVELSLSESDGWKTFSVFYFLFFPLTVSPYFVTVLPLFLYYRLNDLAFLVNKISGGGLSLPGG